MDRYFIAYKINEAHRKAALQAKTEAQAQPQPQLQTQPQTQPPQPQNPQTIKSQPNSSNEEKQFEEYITEWMYKAINSF